MVGNTVSKNTVSVEKESVDPGLVSTLSFFLQEKIKNEKVTMNNNKQGLENRVINVF